MFAQQIFVPGGQFTEVELGAVGCEEAFADERLADGRRRIEPRKHVAVGASFGLRTLALRFALRGAARWPRLLALSLRWSLRLVIGWPVPTLLATVVFHVVNGIVILKVSKSKKRCPSELLGSPKTWRNGKRNISSANSFGSSVPSEFGDLAANRLRSSARLITPGAPLRKGTSTELVAVNLSLGGWDRQWRCHEL